jgi:ankyrin repeat protein
MTALWCSQVACARALLARGAHTDTRLAVSGATPLHIGAQVGSVDTVCALVEYGGDTRAVDNYGRRPTDVARQCAHAHIVRLLDDADASTTAQRAANGKHRLHTAHSATLDSGVSSNNDQDSPPSTWPAKTPNVTLVSVATRHPCTYPVHS